MPLNAQAGSASANSYGTLSEAVLYFSTQHPIPEKWVLAQSFERENALLTAALDMDGRIDYVGDKATTTQSMEWPRIINDTYELIDDEFPFDDDEIPLKLKYAQFEWALYHLASTAATVAAGTVDTLKIGSSVEVKYAAGSAGATTDTTVDSYGVPIKAARHLRGMRIIPVLA